MDLKQGSVINGRYRIERTLGEHGAKGPAVVAARKLDDNTMVAIQILAEGASERRVAMRFARAREVRSVHMPTYLDVGRIDESRPYVVMSLLEGMNLRRLHDRKPLAVDRAVDYVLQACDALAAAHAINLVHRRLQTSSLFLATNVPEPEAIKVLDFTSLLPNNAETKENEGIVEFEAPETFSAGTDPDRRSDLWSIGVILYELLTGKLPFTARSRDKLLKRIQSETPTAPSSLRKDIPKALDGVVLKCLQRDLGARWSSVAELAPALVPFGTAVGQSATSAIAQALNHPASRPSVRPPAGPPAVARNAGDPASAPAINVFDSGDARDAPVAFQRMTKDGRIEGMNADSVVSYNRAKRIAEQTETLSKQGPRGQAQGEDEGDVRAIGADDPAARSGPQLVSAADEAPAAAAAAPRAPTAAASAAASDPRAAKIVGVLVLTVAIVFGLLVGVIWKLVLQR